MLTDLVLVNSAMGSPGPDPSRHAAMQCGYGGLRRLPLDISSRIYNKSPDTKFA